MSIADITNRRHVLDAIAEFDRIGRDQFLAKYGFGPSRAYWLIHDGKRYDSKAIIGAARGFARPDIGPMSAAEFSGGDATVRRKLESLNFEVDAAAPDGSNDKAFLLTWKESGWPHENIVRMHETFVRQGYVDEPWRLRAHRIAKVGDRVWLLCQGDGPKGIFGRGTIIGPAAIGDAGNGKRQMMAPIRFSAFVDPKKELLISETQAQSILAPAKLRARASGYPLTDEEAGALEALLPGASKAGPLIKPQVADESPFDPSDIADARERISRTIAQRRGQSAFRSALIDAYEGRCVVTNCDVLDVLEAAHIFPYRGPDTNKISNGLLLRADIHTLFDCALLTVDPETLTVIVAPALRNGDYRDLHGRSIRPPKHTSLGPSREALTLHRRESGL